MITPERRHFECYEIDALLYARDLQMFNNLFSEQFEPLEREHFDRGRWFVVIENNDWVGFAGLVPLMPFPNIGYLKRCAILPQYRGYGLQRKLMVLREATARASRYTHLVSSCDITNIPSANNFIKSGYLLTKPERPWEEDSLYWIKKL